VGRLRCYGERLARGPAVPPLSPGTPTLPRVWQGHWEEVAREAGVEVTVPLPPPSDF